MSKKLCLFATVALPYSERIGAKTDGRRASEPPSRVTASPSQSPVRRKRIDHEKNVSGQIESVLRTMSQSPKRDTLLDAGWRLAEMQKQLQQSAGYDHQLDQLFLLTQWRIAELARATKPASNVVSLRPRR
ncbi:hypothetical protein [Pelagibacterium sp.]|uniref:hypothetical protein n=1 Tax=Pelagibacterium sp. TaxID=1967288 RepID=UPI003BAC2F36